MISQVGVDGAMPLSKERLTDLYGIAQSDIASAGCFITMNGSFPEEAIMIEAKDSGAKSRIVSALNRVADETPQKILESVHSAVDAFVADAPQFDDLTMMCLQYNGGGIPQRQDRADEG